MRRKKAGNGAKCSHVDGGNTGEFAMSSPDLFDPSLPSRAAAQLISVVPCRRTLHHADPALPTGGHRSRTVAALAAWLAPFVGEGTGVNYVIPDATLLSTEACTLGIGGEDDLFGGVVPTRTACGKAITHCLAEADHTPPPGWSECFGNAVRAHTLPGLSVFSPPAVRAAGVLLLKNGPVRLKPAWSDGGHGQVVVETTAALDAAIEALDARDLAVWGLVVERDLAEAVTFSVGRLQVGHHALAYVGTQSTTRDNAGGSAYGGSRLMVVKGGFAALAAAGLSPVLRRVVAHAEAYDTAADRHIDGFFASRRNYDVVMGRAAGGEILSGVLEASWRIGGASGAEIAALHAFAATPEAGAVRASCHEVYGRTAEPPKEADVYYAGDDPEVGYLTKYALVEARSHA